LEGAFDGAAEEEGGECFEGLDECFGDFLGQGAGEEEGGRF